MLARSVLFGLSGGSGSSGKSDAASDRGDGCHSCAGDGRGGTDSDCGVRDGSIKTVEQQRCLCPAGAPPLGGGIMAVMAPLGHQQREAECSSDLSMW